MKVDNIRYENKYLDELNELVSVLNKSEKELAKKHLIAYQSNHTKNSKKMLQLFQKVTDQKNMSFNKIKNSVSPESTLASFNRLISRTMDRVLESLIVDVNISRKDSYSEIFKRKYILRKQLLQAHILSRKGLALVALKLYDKVIRVAILYELYDEVIEALLEKLQIASGGREGLSTKEIKIKIDSFERERIELREIRYLIQDYSAVAAKKSDKSSLKLTLEQCIRKVQKRCTGIESLNAKSILLLLQIEYASIVEEVRVLIDKGVELNNLLISSPAVYSEVRIVYVYNDLTRADIQRYRFDSALVYAMDSSKILNGKKKLTYVTLNELLLRIYFWKNQLSKSSKTIDHTLSLAIINKYSLRKTKFLFYQSIIKFSLQEYKDSFKLLNDLRLIEKDKEGWNVWIRIMRILCSIEMLRLSLVDYDIESFRKYIQRISKDGNINARVQHILKILVELDRCNFDFKVVAQKRKAELDQLKQTKGKFKWDIKSPEMILFHDWFEAKLNNRDYEANIEPYRRQVAMDEAKPLSKAKERKYKALGLID